ncbi:MAG TPA: serine/threonine-protein kinase [Gemmatimonadaceae bacterium]|nr:serine/threonine-protein kinase [Gemmatimonadaceae bacterium]
MSPPPQDGTVDPLVGQVVGDRYRVTGLLGEGGMGRVYTAEHIRMGRRCALKVMSPALAHTADAITRFNREAANASRINHPNVAAVYDFGETPDGLLYIAMEYVEGETLHALIARQGPLPLPRAAGIARGVADALAAAHHLEIVHRDLKPDNIMLTRQVDGSDWVKVVDFGIAKSIAAPGAGSGGQTVTTAGVSLGTPEYMSPEQLAGERLDHRTDIYSLGLVLFNMLTGDLPYPRLTSKETLVKRLTSAPATLADVRPDLAWPPAVQAVLTRALDPEPDRRYSSASDFGRAIMAAAADPALAATLPHVPPARVRTSPPTQAAPPVARKRGIRSAVTVLVVLLVAAGVYGVSHARPEATNAPAKDAPANADSAAPAKAAPESTNSSAPASAGSARAGATSTQAVPAPVKSASKPPATPQPNSPPDRSVQKALAAMRGHVQSAGAAVARGQPLLAQQEVRQAQAEVRDLREAAPNGELPLIVQRQLRGIPAEVVRACYATAAGDPQASARCRSFQAREERGRNGRGGRGAAGGVVPDSAVPGPARG